MDPLLGDIRNAVISFKKDEIVGLVDQALDKGLEPTLIIEHGLVGAMDQVGEQFSQGVIYVPEMMVAAMTMKEGLARVKPHLAGGGIQEGKTVVIATVKGDLHDIGKNIVAMMLESAGFNVVDLGVDLSMDQLKAGLDKHQPQVLGLSALLTTTMPEMQKVLEELEEGGYREQIKVLVGGAPVDQSFADKIGADGYARDAAGAVKLVRSILN